MKHQMVRDVSRDSIKNDELESYLWDFLETSQDAVETQHANDDLGALPPLPLLR